eukprot:4719137-Pleurochrysis_carterae.AAC.2
MPSWPLKRCRLRRLPRRPAALSRSLARRLRSHFHRLAPPLLHSPGVLSPSHLVSGTAPHLASVTEPSQAAPLEHAAVQEALANLPSLALLHPDGLWASHVSPPVTMTPTVDAVPLARVPKGLASASPAVAAAKVAALLGARPSSLGLAAVLERLPIAMPPTANGWPPLRVPT